MAAERASISIYYNLHGLSDHNLLYLLMDIKSHNDYEYIMIPVSVLALYFILIFIETYTFIE